MTLCVCVCAHFPSIVQQSGGTFVVLAVVIGVTHSYCSAALDIHSALSNITTYNNMKIANKIDKMFLIAASSAR